MNTTPPPHRRGFTWLEFVVLIGVLAVAAYLIVPPLIHTTDRGRDRIVALINGKRLALAMMEFASEYGSFPDRESAIKLMKDIETPLKLEGDSANDYFRQLIAAGVVSSEDPFYARTPYSPKKPDNNFSGTEALRAGEVGFGYVMNGTKALPNDNPKLIIAVTPLLNAGAIGEFDSKIKSMAGSAVLVYLDGSAKLVPIRKDKKVIVNGGYTLLDSGEKSIWGNDIKPVIKPPLKP